MHKLRLTTSSYIISKSVRNVAKPTIDISEKPYRSSSSISKKLSSPSLNSFSNSLNPRTSTVPTSHPTLALEQIKNSVKMEEDAINICFDVR